MHRLTGLPIQDVEIPVLVRLGKSLDRLSLDLHVEEDGLIAGVVVPDVVMHLLVVPLERAVFEAERQDRIGEKVDARSFGAVAEWIGCRSYIYNGVNNLQAHYRWYVTDCF